MASVKDPLIKMKTVTSIKKENFSLIWSVNHFGEFLDRKYEFSSPVFKPNSEETSRWKLVLFPEIVYPEGGQIALRLINVSNDDKCYSINYRISIFDKNGSEQVLRYREKVFRHYLDYDQCIVVCNQTIKDKCLLQNNGTLTICCEMDVLYCVNPDDKTPESQKLPENISVPLNNVSMTIENSNNSHELNDLSSIDKKLTKSENLNNSLSSNNTSFENTCKSSGEGVKVMNGLPRMNDNVFSAPMLKVEKKHFNKNSYKHQKGFIDPPNEYEKKASGPSEKNDRFSNKTRENAKRGNENSKYCKELDILSNDLNFLYTTKYQYDVTIKTKDGQIHAHKAILAARSDYFWKILIQGKGDIQIPIISNATLKAILFYLYTGQSPQITFKLGMDILRVCDEFHLDYLKEMAENSIRSQMNINNVTDIFEIATELKLENLKTHALKFIAKNNEAVTNSSKWNEMINTNPHGTGEILLTIASFQNKLNRY